jgi:hypothetical protein
MYKRRRRWVQSEDERSFKLGLGVGDDAEYSIDDILEFVQPAVFQFVDLFENVVDSYLDLISKEGILLTEKGIRIKIL